MTDLTKEAVPDLPKERHPRLENFEDVLSHVGGWGFYQVRLLLFFLCFCVFLAYVTYAPVIFLFEPDHHCKPHPSFKNSSLSPDEILNITSPITDGQRDQCLMYNITLDEVRCFLGTFKINITKPIQLLIVFKGWIRIGWVGACILSIWSWVWLNRILQHNCHRGKSILRRWNRISFVYIFFRFYT